MKVLKTTAGSSAMVIAGEGYTQLTAGPNSITVQRDEGVFINGALSITSQVDNIKIGGIYRLNPLLSTGLASTLITPIPTLVIDLPIKNLKSMASLTNLLRSIL